MIKGAGIDLFESRRFAQSKFKRDLTRQIFTEKELFRYLRTKVKNRKRNFGSAFAAKEALLKAFGCGLSYGSYWRSIDINKTKVECSGFPSRQNTRRSDTGIHIAHAGTAKYSIAIAVLE